MHNWMRAGWVGSDPQGGSDPVGTVGSELKMHSPLGSGPGGAGPRGSGAAGADGTRDADQGRDDQADLKE